MRWTQRGVRVWPGTALTRTLSGRYAQPVAYECHDDPATVTALVAAGNVSSRVAVGSVLSAAVGPVLHPGLWQLSIQGTCEAAAGTAGAARRQPLQWALGGRSMGSCEGAARSGPAPARACAGDVLSAESEPKFRVLDVGVGDAARDVMFSVYLPMTCAQLAGEPTELVRGEGAPPPSLWLHWELRSVERMRTPGPVRCALDTDHLPSCLCHRRRHPATTPHGRSEHGYT
jgi:hypothetical protein